MKCSVRTTLRIDDNLKTRIENLAIKNNFSLNKMLNYLLEMGYQAYMKRFDNCYEEQNIILENEINNND